MRVIGVEAMNSKPISVKPLGRVSSVRLVPENAHDPIVVTPSGIWMLVRLSQLENILSPIWVRPLGSVTLDKFLQPSNAPLSISVTLSGIRMLVRPD